MNATPILLAWSGGKDCLMTLQRLRADPGWRVAALLTTIDRTNKRAAMHGIRREILRAQAASLRLPILEVEMDGSGNNEAYEAAHERALSEAQLRWPDIHHCAFGDLFLEDVRDYRVRQLGRAAWRAIFPIWGEDTSALARRFVAEGHRAVVCCVDTRQLSADCCGCPYDDALLDRLPAGVDACGERGELHTLSFGGPLFAHDLRLRRGESVLHDDRFQLTDFSLEDHSG